MILILTDNKDWLLSGNIDKPAYFVLKVPDTSTMASYKDITLLKTEGGFAFYRRKAIQLN